MIHLISYREKKKKREKNGHNIGKAKNLLCRWDQDQVCRGVLGSAPALGFGYLPGAVAPWPGRVVGHLRLALLLCCWVGADDSGGLEWVPGTRTGLGEPQEMLGRAAGALTLSLLGEVGTVKGSQSCWFSSCLDPDNREHFWPSCMQMFGCSP